MSKAIFLGTFSTHGYPDARSGMSGKEPKIYWFVWEDKIANSYLSQQLDTGFNPKGAPDLLQPLLFRQFTREPMVTLIPEASPDMADYLNEVFVAGETREQVLVGGSAPRAEPAKKITNVQRVDKEMREEYDYNRRHLTDVSNKETAADAISHLATREEGVVPEHKHIFTFFAIDLRKGRFNELALKHFSRAVALSPNDSHANFNMARILYEMGKRAEAKDFLERALTLEPNLDYALILKKRLGE